MVGLALLLIFTLSGCLASDCCEKKEVGGINYKLSHTAEETFGNCYDTCIYTLEQDDGTTFCFGPGDDVPFCKDPTTAAPTTTTTTTTTTTAASEDSTSTASGDSTSTESSGARYNFLAGLTYSWDSSNSPFCAGALVSSRWVITSASCSYADSSVVSPDTVNVMMGST